jgi:hypothetical protein
LDDSDSDRLLERPPPLFGLDIHTKRIFVCVERDGASRPSVSGAGYRGNDASPQGLPDRFELWYEVSCGYGHSYDLLRPLAVAHPGRLRLIFRSKNKNDRNGAERLAKLLYLGETPAVQFEKSPRVPDFHILNGAL